MSLSRLVLGRGWLQSWRGVVSVRGRSEAAAEKAEEASEEEGWDQLGAEAMEDPKTNAEAANQLLVKKAESKMKEAARRLGPGGVREVESALLGYHRRRKHTSDSYRWKAAAAQRLSREVEAIFPDHQLHITGGSATGLGTRHSDLDICLTVPEYVLSELDTIASEDGIEDSSSQFHKRSISQFVLGSIYRRLKNTPKLKVPPLPFFPNQHTTLLLSQAQFIVGATVPILRIWMDFSKEENIFDTMNMYA